MEPEEVLQLQAIVDLGVMAMKGHCIIPRSPELVFHNSIKSNIILKPPFRWEVLALCKQV